MQVSVETTEGLERRMTVAVPAEQVDEKIAERFKKLKQSANIKGFRPGKVPAKVLHSRFGESVRYEVIEEVMRDSLQKAFTEKELEPAGMPMVESSTSEEGKPLEYVVKFEVFPEISLKTLEGVEIAKQEVELVESDITDALEKIRGQHAEWVDVERASKSGDKIVIDFLGTVDGVAFEGGNASEFELELGSSSMIPGFEDGIIGMKAGEEKDINVSFPEDYPHGDLAGKASVFNIKAHTVKEAKLPELNDEFAEKLGVEGKTIDALKAEVKDMLNSEIDKAILGKSKQGVLTKLAEVNPIDIPQTLVRAELDALKQRAINQARGTVTPESLPDALYEEEAKKRVHLALLLREVIKHYELNLDQDKLRAHLEAMVATFPQKEEMLKYLYSNQEMMNEAQTTVLEDQAVEKLLADATVKAETTSYTKFMEEAQKD